ncbi:MAG: hypothetical protein IJM94_00020 [Clostridia bacterium]|nr:hypothetical protein [Clostridia bacterium]MBQ4543010.1 hypothetical protein [Clostridia bacterium]MBQ7075162.1 hypothetical protein [Clostridia bacterium]MBQ9997787.1 hypothetical protein [Clostridia bacterium]
MKKLSTLIITVIFAFNCVAFATQLNTEVVNKTDSSFTLELTLAEEIAPSIKVNGEVMKYDPAPFTKDDRMYVPVRQILEQNGYYVNYDDKTATVSAINTSNNHYIVMQIGNKTYSSGDKTYEFDVAPIVIEGRTFVPVRIMYEMMGCKVDYDEATNTAIITK